MEALRLHDLKTAIFMNGIAPFFNAEGNSRTIGANHGVSQFMLARAIHYGHASTTLAKPSLSRVPILSGLCSFARNFSKKSDECVEILYRLCYNILIIAPIGAKEGGVPLIKIDFDDFPYIFFREKDGTYHDCCGNVYQ